MSNPRMIVKKIHFKPNWSKGLCFKDQKAKNLFIKEIFNALDEELTAEPYASRGDSYIVDEIYQSQCGYSVYFKKTHLFVCILNNSLGQKKLHEISGGYSEIKDLPIGLDYVRDENGTIFCKTTNEIIHPLTVTEQISLTPQLIEISLNKYQISKEDKAIVEFAPDWDKDIKYYDKQAKKNFINDICEWIKDNRNTEEKFFLIKRASVDTNCFLHIAINDPLKTPEMFCFKKLKPEIKDAPVPFLPERSHFVSEEKSKHFSAFYRDSYTPAKGYDLKSYLNANILHFSKLQKKDVSSRELNHDIKKDVRKLVIDF